MFPGCIHPLFASAEFAMREGQSAAAGGRKMYEKPKIHVGEQMVIGRQKTAAGILSTKPQRIAAY